MLESLYNYEIQQNIAIQQLASKWGLQNFLVLLSKLVRVENLLLYFIPLIALYKHAVFRRVLFLVTFSVFATLCLKWIFSEIRPNWMKLASPTKLLYGGEYCESTAGFPSGHLVIATGLLCVIIRYAVKILSKNNELLDENTVKLLSSIFSVILLTLLTLSQMSLGVSFLHQCLAGVVIGYVIAYFLFKKSVNHYYKEISMVNALGIVAGMALTVVLIYYGKSSLKMNPHWDSDTAAGKCKAPGNLHIEDTSIYGFCCTFGILIGLALSSPLKDCGKGMRLVLGSPAVFAVMALQHFLTRSIPRIYGDSVFYGLIMLSYLVYTVTLVYAIPKAIYSMMDAEKAAEADAIAIEELKIEAEVEIEEEIKLSV